MTAAQMSKMLLLFLFICTNINVVVDVAAIVVDLHIGNICRDFTISRVSSSLTFCSVLFVHLFAGSSSERLGCEDFYATIAVL